MTVTTPPERVCQVQQTLNGPINRVQQVPVNNRVVVVPDDE